MDIDWALIFIHKLNVQLSYCRGCLLSSLSVKRLLETDLIDHHVLLYSTVLITPSSDTARWCVLIIHLIYAKSSLLSYIKYYDIWSRVLTSYQPCFCKQKSILLTLLRIFILFDYQKSLFRNQYEIFEFAFGLNSLRGNLAVKLAFVRWCFFKVKFWIWNKSDFVAQNFRVFNNGL